MGGIALIVGDMTRNRNARSAADEALSEVVLENIGPARTVKSVAALARAIDMDADQLRAYLGKKSDGKNMKWPATLILDIAPAVGLTPGRLADEAARRIRP